MFPIRDTIPSRNPPIATWLLILANSVIFLFELTMPQPALDQFFHLFGIVPARFTHPEWAFWVGLPIRDYWPFLTRDRKSTRLNSSHGYISYAVFCLKKKKEMKN